MARQLAQGERGAEKVGAPQGGGGGGGGRVATLKSRMTTKPSPGKWGKPIKNHTWAEDLKRNGSSSGRPNLAYNLEMSEKSRSTSVNLVAIGGSAKGAGDRKKKKNRPRRLRNLKKKSHQDKPGGTGAQGHARPPNGINNRTVTTFVHRKGKTNPPISMTDRISSNAKAERSTQKLTVKEKKFQGQTGWKSRLAFPS